MILHVSLAADDPRNSAQMLATLMGGVAIPMRGPAPGTWIAVGADPVGNAVELIFDGSTAPKAAFVPAGTVHDAPMPPAGVLRWAASPASIIRPRR